MAPLTREVPRDSEPVAAALGKVNKLRTFKPYGRFMICAILRLQSTREGEAQVRDSQRMPVERLLQSTREGEAQARKWRKAQRSGDVAIYARG